MPAWIGIIGVGIGVVLSFGAQMVSDWIKERRARERELTEASYQLIGVCGSLVNLLRAFPPQFGAMDRLPWLEAMNRETERISRFGLPINRYANNETADAAEAMVQTAYKVIRSESPDDVRPELDVAIVVFQAACQRGGLRQPLIRRRKRPVPELVSEPESEAASTIQAHGGLG